MGEPGSAIRNEKIAAAIHETGLAETKGSGIQAMRQAMKNVSLEPFFESSRENDSFAAILLLHHLLSEEDVVWLEQLKDCGLNDDEARALVTVRETGAITNERYRSLSGLDTLAASKRLQRLRDLGLLEQRGRSSATYYVAGKRLQDSLSASANLFSEESNLRDKPLSLESNLRDKPLSLESNLPAYLQEQIANIGPRAGTSEITGIILAICEWQPMSASAIAKVVGRDVTYLRKGYLTPLVRQGKLEYTLPKKHNDPRQAYKVKHEPSM